jgi:hypothetical protein
LSHPQKLGCPPYYTAYFRNPLDYVLGNSGISSSRKSSFFAGKRIVIAFTGMSLKLIWDYYSLYFSFTGSVKELQQHLSHYFHY